MPVEGTGATVEARAPFCHGHSPGTLGRPLNNADSRSSHPVMHFTETKIAEVVFAEPDVFEDQRGLFAVAWMPEEFAARGLDTRIAQANLALTRERGSIRGIHFQAAPFEEAKVVRVVRGAVSMWRSTCGRTRPPSCNGSAPS